MGPEEEAGLPSSDLMSSRWRPMMGWMYMAVCIFDFIIFPILWTSIQAYDQQGVIGTEWDPLTLKGGGLFHVAMGAVLGVAAWSRGQEKITAMNINSSPGYSNSPSTVYRPTYRPPVQPKPYNIVPQNPDPPL